jgi:hypothetical protein
LRHCERSEAIQRPQRKTGLLRRFAPRNDGIASTVILRSRALARRLEGRPQAPALVAYPSRLAQEGERLRMTAVFGSAKTGGRCVNLAGHLRTC